MKLTVDEIQDRVEQIEEERADYTKAAEVWESMWMLKAFDRSVKDAINVDGVEQVTTPTPYNIVQLAGRLIASLPRIEVPSSSAEDDDEGASEKRERWLNALWERTNRQQRTDVVANAAWQSLVRGRHAFEIKWVKEELPKRLQEKRLPILIRTLDPFNVGTRTGAYYTEYAYHKWETSRLQVKQWFPQIRFKDLGRRRRLSVKEEDEEVTCVDFWWLDDEGAVWNAIIVEEQFGKQPAKTEYPDIPIVEGYGDTAPLSNELYKGVSILHPLKEMWPYECRLASQLGTGMLYNYLPIITLKSNRVGEDVEIKPGGFYRLGMEDSLEMVQPNVNMPLAQSVLGMVDAAIQTSTFPGVMYGQQPGQVQAGYAVNILANQAMGRVAQVRNNLEATIELVNEIALGLVESFAGKEGVTVWGTEEGSGSIYHETLAKADIGGYYENNVTLIPEVVQDEAQKITLMMQMVDKGILSRETGRDKYINMALPRDEALRVETEMALMGELAPKAQLKALQKRFPDTWEVLIAGTQYEQIAQQEAQMMAQQEGAGQENMPPPEVLAALMAQMQGGGGMPPGGMPSGPMADMGGMGGAPMGGGGLGSPDEGAMAGGPPGLPPGMMPPEMSGQMTPEMLGLPPGTPPEIVAQLLQNAPPGVMEQLRAMGALPPQGMGG